MKSIYSIPTILLFFFACTLNAQNCNFEVEEVDMFTDKSTLLTISEIANEKGKYIYLEILNSGSNYTLTLNYTEKAMKANGWYCTSDDPLILLFSDNSKLELYPLEFTYKTEKIRMDQLASGFLGNLAAFKDKFVFAPEYTITKKELENLSEKTLTNLRITAKGKSLNTLESIENIEFEIEEDNAILIQNDSKCILEKSSNPNSKESKELEIENYQKVMNPAFSEDFEDMTVTIEGEIFSTEGVKIWAYPSKVSKFIKFQCIAIGSDPIDYPFVGQMGNIFCIDKTKADIIFTLSKGDKVRLTGSTYTYKKMGSEDVYFIVESLEKI